MNETQNVLGAT
jgi:hypothetical protein